jgi:hypothetical protein
MLYSPTVEYHYLYEVAFVRQLILDTAVADPEGRALVEPDKPYAQVHNWRISTARFGAGCIAELPAERLPEPGPWPWISAWLDDAWHVAASEAHCGASLAPPDDRAQVAGRLLPSRVTRFSAEADKLERQLMSRREGGPALTQPWPLMLFVAKGW